MALYHRLANTGFAPVTIKYQGQKMGNSFVAINCSISDNLQANLANEIFALAYTYSVPISARNFKMGTLYINRSQWIQFNNAGAVLNVNWNEYNNHFMFVQAVMIGLSDHALPANITAADFQKNVMVYIPVALYQSEIDDAVIPINQDFEFSNNTIFINFFRSMTSNYGGGGHDITADATLYTNTLNLGGWAIQAAVFELYMMMTFQTF